MYGDDATRQRCRQLAGSHLLRRCRRERIVQHQHIAASIDEYMALRAVTNHPRRDVAAVEIGTECALGPQRAGDMDRAIRKVELTTAVRRVGTDTSTAVRTSATQIHEALNVHSPNVYHLPMRIR